jgi:hypothetical protein
VRLFSSLRLVVAPPACKPGQDTPAIFVRVLTTGSGSATDCVGAFARGHGSRLFSLKLLLAHSPAVSFLTSPALGSFSRNLPSSRGLPDACAPFVRLSAFFAGRFQYYSNPPEPSAPCRYTAATIHPWGDCDSSGTETSPDYLTQFAAASYRGLLPSPSFAFDDVRTSPEELVNSASPELALRFQRSRVNQPDPTFPQSPGIILKRTTSILLAAARFVLSMNWKHSSRKFISAHQLICTIYSPKKHGEQAANNQ